MSADNILIIRRHPLGDFGIAVGFLSDEEYMNAKVHPKSTRYPTPQAAMIAAEAMDSEYGETYHEEIREQATICHHCGKSLLEPKVD